MMPLDADMLCLLPLTNRTPFYVAPEVRSCVWVGPWNDMLAHTGMKYVTLSGLQPMAWEQNHKCKSALQVVKLSKSTTGSDVYSFGIMSVELWSGKPPFVLGDNGKFRANSGFMGGLQGCPEPFSKLVWKCLATKPQDRPSMTEIRRCLEVSAAPALS